MGGVLREGRLKNRANRLDHEKLYILQSYLMIWRGPEVKWQEPTLQPVRSESKSVYVIYQLGDSKQEN